MTSTSRGKTRPGPRGAHTATPSSWNVLALAAKPFRRCRSWADGAADRFGLHEPRSWRSPCASHSSEPAQVARVRELLGKIGCSERDLLCGRTAVVRPGGAGTTRLAACASRRSIRTARGSMPRHAGAGAPPRLAHGVLYAARAPVQQRGLAEVSRWTEVPAAEIKTRATVWRGVLWACTENRPGVCETRPGRGSLASRIAYVAAMLASPRTSSRVRVVRYRDDARAPCPR